MEAEKTLELQCSDGLCVSVSPVFIRDSVVLTNILSFTTVGDEPVVLEFIDSTTIKIICTLCDFFKDEPMYDPTEAASYRPPVTHPAMIYMKHLTESQWNVINIALDFLDMPRLIDFTLYYVLSLMGGHDIKSLRRVYHLPDNYTQEDEEVNFKLHRQI